MPPLRQWTRAGTFLAYTMKSIDGTVVNVALPALQVDLQASITEVQWVVEAYALFLGALILAGGSLGDQIGRKRVFLFGVALFTVASILCGIATSAPALITAPALPGIVAVLLSPGGPAIVTDTCCDTRRRL